MENISSLADGVNFNSSGSYTAVEVQRQHASCRTEKRPFIAA